MKVLVAEDDPMTRDALVNILSAEGFFVIATSDGKTAIERCKSQKPDIACLDIMMPGLSGYEVCKAIKQLDPHIGVLFISAKSEEFDRVLGLELGADDFIPKPFGVHEVIARVRALVRRMGQTRTGPRPSGQEIDALSFGEFDFGPWHIGSAQMRATNEEGQKLDLSLRELKILQLLWQKKGQAISRSEFFKVCWDQESDVETRTLDQCIARLRKKVEKDPANPLLIQTVSGIGYRFEL